MNFNLFGVPIDHLSSDQLEQLLQSWICGHGQHFIVTPNPEFILQAIREPWFLKAIKDADLSLPDAAGLRYAIAAEGLGKFIYRHTGVDTLEKLVKICEKNNKKLLILGGEGSRAKRAAETLRRFYPNADITGHNPGTLLVKNYEMLIDETTKDYIKACQPDVIALALNQTKQLHFIKHLKEFPSIKITIGVGGAVDMFSGELPRAPFWMRKSGLEWLWRLCIEPKRAKRIANATIVFPVLVAFKTIKGGYFLAACKRVLPEIINQLKGK
ncbi:WecB/TagA/CpsF family glycosyltransferase [Patescibacteria group bacterium]|nr:WecB/TagA/CpsF family glycosyltransferase [Patescibacteria group bacterium]